VEPEFAGIGRLSVHQRGGAEATARERGGDGVDIRRRVLFRVRHVGHLRSENTGVRGKRDLGVHAVQGRVARVLVLRHGGRAGERRTVRPADGVAVGARQHWIVRRQPEQRDAVRRVRRRGVRFAALAIAVEQEPV